MQAALVTKFERNVDRAASAIFATACAYASYLWFSAHLVQPALGAETGGVAAIAYVCCARVLNNVHPRSARLPVPVFDVREVEALDLPELMLTDRYDAPERAEQQQPLELDDILAELGPDSRVVRLFDPAAMPSPAELKSRIDRHLDRGSPEQSADAAQALHEALAELRRSIR